MLRNLSSFLLRSVQLHLNMEVTIKLYHTFHEQSSASQMHATFHTVVLSLLMTQLLLNTMPGR